MVSSELSECTYVTREGVVCAHRCYGQRCKKHKRSTSHTLCRNGCGRGTLSVTAFCNKCEPGQSGLQGFILQRMRRNAKLHPVEAEPTTTAELQRKKQEAEWDAYIDDCVVELVSSSHSDLSNATI